MTIEVSVVIPVFNGIPHLCQTLDSLASQTVPLGDVVVIDDGSTDGSAAAAASHPLKPRVIARGNAGVAYSRNIGVAHARGTHVALLDQDDLWGRCRHERLRAYLSAHLDARALVTTCTSFHESGDSDRLAAVGDHLHRGTLRVEAGSDVAELVQLATGGVPALLRKLSTSELLAGPPSVTASYVVERELYQAAGGCVPFARSFDDWMLLLHLSMATDIHFVDEPSLLYRVHSSSTTMTTTWSAPLLAALNAVRTGGNVVTCDDAAHRVPPIIDDRHFFHHHLLQLAAAPGRAADALAFAQLLATDERERRSLVWEVLKRSIGSRIRARLGSSGG